MLNTVLKCMVHFSTVLKQFAKLEDYIKKFHFTLWWGTTKQGNCLYNNDLSCTSNQS